MSIQTDPEAIRKFADELTTVIIFLSGRLGELPRNVARLGRTWQDEQFAQFKVEADRTNSKLSEYLEDLKKIRAELQRDIDAAEALQRSGGSL